MTIDPVNRESAALPTRRDARLNRERVLQAAIEVFSERGVDAEVREIADRAGVGIGTVYRNFASKDELIDGLILQLQDEIRPHIEAAALHASPAQALERLARQAFEHVERYGAVLMLMYHHRPQTIRAARDTLVGPVTDIVRRGMDSGEFRNDISPEFITLYFEAAMPNVYVELRQRFSAREAADGMVALFLSALQPAPTGS